MADEVQEAKSEVAKSKAKREALTEERKAKEEELLIRSLNAQLKKAFDAEYGNDPGAIAQFFTAFGASPEQINLYLQELTPDAIGKLRMLLSDNPSTAGAYAFMAQQQQRQQGMPFDITNMLKFFEFIDKVSPGKTQQQASNVTAVRADTGLNAVVLELLKQRDRQTEQMLTLYKDVLSNQQTSQITTAQREMTELKNIIKESLGTGQQQPGIKEYLTELKDNVGLLQSMQQQPQDFETAKLNIDWEREKKRMELDAHREMAELNRGTEMIKTIRETLQDTIEGLGKPIIDSHREGLKEKIEAAKFKRDQAVKNGNFSTTPSGTVVIHPPTPENPPGMEGQLGPMPDKDKKDIEIQPR